ncbi:MAG: ATP-binding protein [Candidatus Auribacterota bacterium]
MSEAILIVDKNEAHRKTLENILQLRNFRTIGVENGSKAIELLQHVEIDLVILAVSPSDAPDESVLKFIHEKKNNEKVAVLLLGESHVLESKIPLYPSYIDDYLQEPFSPEQLVGRISILLKKLYSQHDTLLRTDRGDIEKEADQFTAIGRIFDATSTEADISDIFRLIAQEILRLIEFDIISIILKKVREDRFKLLTLDKKRFDEITTKDIYLSMDHGPGRVFRNDEIFIEQDTWQEVNSRLEYELIYSADVRSSLIMPLHSGHTVIGTLNLGAYEPNYYSNLSVEGLKYVIKYISMAVENVHLHTVVRDLNHKLQVTLNERNAEIEKKYYQLSLINKVGQAMQGTLDIDNLLNLILTCVTAGGAIGFNRAFLLRVNYDKEIIEGIMGVGPSSWEEAWQIWDRLSKENWKLDDFLAHRDYNFARKNNLDTITRSLKLSLNNTSDFVVMSVREKRPFLVTEAMRDNRVNKVIKEKLMVNEFVIVPLLARDKVLGVIIADNLFNGKPIDQDSMQLLNMFANQAGLALERANAYEKLTHKITELKEAYEELKETQSKLVRTERLATIGKMAAHVAHEIRNPLATIGGFAHSMYKFPQDEEKVQRNASIIRDEVYRLENILRGVLDFTKPASPVFALGELNRVVEDTIILLQKDLQVHNIDLVLNLDHELPRILLDSQQIKQAIYNIFKNALHSMLEVALPGNGGNLRHKLSVTTEIIKDYVQLHIRDTGNGMLPHVMENLFNPFFTTKNGGSGLGLAVTHKIIEDHGGFIDVKSQVGKGSEFIVYLPLRTETATTERGL